MAAIVTRILSFPKPLPPLVPEPALMPRLDRLPNRRLDRLTWLPVPVLVLVLVLGPRSMWW